MYIIYMYEHTTNKNTNTKMDINISQNPCSRQTVEYKNPF